MKGFRFSLLTLIVAVLLLAGIVYLNLRPSGILTEDPRALIYDVYAYGWPFVACEEFVLNLDTPPDFFVPQGRDWQWLGITVDILVGLAIVLAGAAACEWLVRRRQQKGVP